MVPPDDQAAKHADEPGSDSLAGPLVIDCSRCIVRGPACPDCVVTFLLGGPPEPVETTVHAAGAADPVELSADEVSALDALAGSGMVPPLRLVTAVDDIS